MHFLLVKAGAFDRESFGAQWNQHEAKAKTLNLEQVKEALASQPSMYEEWLNSCTEADLRHEMEMFGSKASRGSWIVSLILLHYAAYRMQLFQYLKSSGREELNTFNLWVGTDGQMN